MYRAHMVIREAVKAFERNNIGPIVPGISLRSVLIWFRVSRQSAVPKRSEMPGYVKPSTLYCRPEPQLGGEIGSLSSAIFRGIYNTHNHCIVSYFLSLARWDWKNSPGVVHVCRCHRE